MNQLFLIRHGSAEDRERWDGDDGLRPLTPKGGKRVRAVARALRRQGLVFDVVISSPLLRARQTAQILADALGRERWVVDAGVLAPGLEQAALWTYLNEHYAKASNIALIGHEPDLGRLASRLLTGGENLTLRLRKAGVCWLEFPEGQNGNGSLAQLRALWEPAGLESQR